MFPCKQCGRCCRTIGKVFFAKRMADPDGVCKYLNRDTNLCRVYAERPLFCNVDLYYDTCLKDKMPREKFYQQNLECCQSLAEKGV